MAVSRPVYSKYLESIMPASDPNLIDRRADQKVLHLVGDGDFRLMPRGQQPHFQSQQQFPPQHKNLLRKKRILDSIDKNCKLFFKFLNKNTTEDKLVQVFSCYGNVIHIRVPYSRKMGKNLGYGYVIFDSSEGPETLMRSGVEIKVDGKVLGFYRFDESKYQNRISASKESHERLNDFNMSAASYFENEWQNSFTSNPPRNPRHERVQINNQKHSDKKDSSNQSSVGLETTQCCSSKLDNPRPTLSRYFTTCRREKLGSHFSELSNFEFRTISHNSTRAIVRNQI